jgi:cell division protein ZipA
MTELQWALIALGIVVIVGVYVYSRYWGESGRASDAREAGDAQGRDPWDELMSDDGLEARDADAFSEAGGQAISDPEPVSGPGPDPEKPPGADELSATSDTAPDDASAGEGANAPAASEAPIHLPEPPPGQEKLIVLHIAVGPGQRLDGKRIHAALKHSKLQFGPHHIYHRIKEVDGVPESVFCVANMMKPGYLDPVEAGELHTRGLSMFMQLPGPLSGARAFRDMLYTAGDLAESLDAKVLDEKKTPLNKQMAQFLHE